MAAILKLRRGTSFTSLQESELFYDTALGTIHLGDGGGSNTTYKTLIKLNESNSGSLYILNDITGSHISASGDITASNLSLVGDADIAGNITLGGDIFLGDGTNATDNINVNASFSGSLIPTTTSVFTLGTDTKKYLDLRVVNATIDNINLPGSGILSSSVTDFTDYSQSVDNRLDVEEAKSVTLETVTSSLDDRLDVEEAKSVTLTSLTSSYDIRLNNLQITSASHDSRLDVEEAKSATLAPLTSSYDIRLSNLQITSASHDNRLDVEEAKSVTLETVTSSLDQRADRLEAYTSSFASDTVTLTNKTINGANNTLTVDISRDTNLAVSDTTEVNMILTDDTISAELIGGVVSGSQQVNADSITNFDENVKTKLDDETVVSGSSQVNYSALSGINNNIVSASTDTDQVDMIINDGSISANLKGGVVSGSSQIDYSGLSGINNNIVSASTDSGRVNFTISDGNITADLIGGVVSGSSQILGGSNLLSSSNENFNGFSSSVDSRLDTIEGPLSTSIDSRLDLLSDVSHSHSNKSTLDGINQGLSTSDNVTFADGDFTGDVQVTGNLTVLGAATEISSTELRIEDKLITVASGSADSAAADGAGLEIDGAGKSIKWDHNTTSFVLDAKVSSSVGFKGEGGELTGIDTDQVTEGSNLYYTDTRVKTKLNAETVVSGSSQIDYSALSGINNNIISASSDTSNIDMIINGGSISANIKGGIVSSSAQISAYNDFLEINGDGVVSSSVQISNYNKFLEIDGDNVFTSSQQVNADTITNFDSNVKAKLDAETVVSGSSQINADTIVNFDSNVKAKLDVETVVSGSSQIDIHSTDGYVANEHIDHSSITIGSGKGLTGGGTIDTNRSLSLDSGSVHFSEGVKKRLDAETVISGSSQVNADSITNFDSNVKTKLDAEAVVSGSSFVSNHQGSITASINSVSTNVDLGLNIDDSPTFNTLTLSSVAAGGSSDFDAVFDVSGLLKKRTIGTAAFLNVSASIADDPNSIPTTKAVNDALVAAGAGDITAVNSTTTVSPSTTGLVHTEDGTEDGGAYGNTGNIVIAIDTGSAHFQAGVELYAPSVGDGGLTTNDFTNDDHTKLNNIELFADVTDAENVLASLPLGVVSGSQQVSYNSITNKPTTISTAQGNKLGFISVTQAVNLDTIESNTSTNNNKVGYTDALVKAKLNTDGVLSGSAQITNGSGLVSSSAQIDSLGFLKVEGDSVVSSSAQIDYDSIQNQPTTITGGQASAISTNTGKVGYTDALVKAKLNEETVVSGSSQITLSSVTGYNANEHFTQGNITALGTVTSGNVTAILPSGVISGSTQLTSNLNSVYLQIDGDGVVSGSSQINSLFAGTAVSTSLDSRIVSLEGDTHTHANKANLDTINQNLATTNNVTFADGDFTGDVQINGSLVVQGSATELQVTELRIEDKLITVASGSSTSLAADGAGIEIAGANESITWDHSNSRFAISDDIHVTGTIKASDDIVAYASSDERLKDNIQPIKNPIEKINSISGNTFVWNEEKQDIYKGKDYGVIAQEIEKVLPELVHTKEDGYKSVKYDKIIPLLIEGIKDLNKEVLELKQIIKESK